MFRKRRNLLTVIKILAGITGAYLIFRLISITGTERILLAFRSHSFALLFLSLLYTTYHILRTITLQASIPYPTSLAPLFGIRLAGEAVAYLSIGSILGDTLKVVLARDKIPVVEGATGVFAEKLIYHLSGAGFILGGLLVAIVNLGTGRVLLYCILGITLFFLGLLFLLSSGVRPAARILNHVKVRRPRLREAILRTEQSLFQFRKDHPNKFLFIFVLDLISYFYSVGEVFVIYHLLGLQPTFWDLWYYQAAIKIMSSANVIVPANVGILEATSALVAAQLRLGAEAGLIAALFVRARALLWCIAGYSWFLYLLLRRKRQEPL